MIRRALVLMLLFSLPSCAKSVKHNETLAGQRAVEFARLAFVKNNFEQAYELLSDGGKRHLGREKFIETITRMHPRSFPTKVTALEYQAMPGENAIWIYLAGQNTDEQFQYRLTLETTDKGDYKVLTFDSGVVARMFSPLSEKHPFKPPISSQ